MEIFKRSRSSAPTLNDANTSITPKPVNGKPINDADFKQFGFVNFGNTCYANSILQALYFCKPFRQFVCEFNDGSLPLPLPIPLPPTPAPVPTTPLPKPPGLNPFPFRRRESTIGNGRVDESSNPPPKSAPPPGLPIPTAPPTLFSALRSLFLHIALNPLEKGTVSPTSFMDKVKEENPAYRSAMHQDAHEFLGFLLNRVAENIKEEIKKNPPSQEANGNGSTDLSSSLGSLPATGPASVTTSSGSRKHQRTDKTFIQDLFEGTLTSETRCLTCENVSSRDESFLDLSIDIEQNSSITACLRQFSASEMLAQKNKFFCDGCGSLQEAEKRMKIKKLPSVLALHLKRFKYQEDRYVKLSYRVAFPFELRLFNTVDDAPDPDRLYQLFAIVVHIGVGAHHGHYITIIKSRGTWYTFDDETVQPIREGDIIKYFGGLSGESGYVLFYQAADVDAEPTTTPSEVLEPMQDGPITAISLANDLRSPPVDILNPPTLSVVPEGPVSIPRLSGSLPIQLKVSIPSQSSASGPKSASSSERPNGIHEPATHTTLNKTTFGTLRSPSFKKEKRPKSSGLENAPNGDVSIISPQRSRPSFFSPSKKKSEKNLHGTDSALSSSSVPAMPPLPISVPSTTDATSSGLPDHAKEGSNDTTVMEMNGTKEGSSSSASVSASTSSVSIPVLPHSSIKDTVQPPVIPPIPPPRSKDRLYSVSSSSPFVPSNDAPLQLPPPPSSPNPRRRNSVRPLTSPSTFIPPETVNPSTATESSLGPKSSTTNSRMRSPSMGSSVSAAVDRSHSITDPTSHRSSVHSTSTSTSTPAPTPQPSTTIPVASSSTPPPVPERSTQRMTDKKLKLRRPSILQTLLGRGHKDKDVATAGN
ncbi:hypothetical protein Clacol_007789 [Clathrus columnatus]|uniref:Ubiquitin carboxyl-terminal hydrolase n=1 Tax=Clathrus columnatus TaxID=1419009 RepID=A0AAV5AKY6_9AGAM|nr:hypothetical protein Clacol_007789 [Clathrus columnatus]